MPTFLLQPLVENALGHGLRQVRSDGVVTVRSGVENGRLVLSVGDNGVGVDGDLSPDAYGIGLGATSERLARMYPGAHTFTLRGRPEGGTEARITLPLKLDAPLEVTVDAPAARAHRR